MKRITIAWLEYFDLHVDVSSINFRNCKKLSKQKNSKTTQMRPVAQAQYLPLDLAQRLDGLATHVPHTSPPRGAAGLHHTLEIVSD